MTTPSRTTYRIQYQNQKLRGGRWTKSRVSSTFRDFPNQGTNFSLELRQEPNHLIRLLFSDRTDEEKDRKLSSLAQIPCIDHSGYPPRRIFFFSLVPSLVLNLIHGTLILAILSHPSTETNNYTNHEYNIHTVTDSGARGILVSALHLTREQSI